MVITEENFVEELKKKNDRALEYTIEKYGWVVKTVMKKHLYGLEEHQEDCGLDVFMAVWEHIESFDPKRSTFQNWLAGISRFKAVDCKRKYLRERQNVTLDNIEIQCVDEGLEHFTQEGLGEEWSAMIACLKKEDRDIFIKRYVEEKDMETLSRETGLEKEVLYNRLSRGKAKVRKRFGMTGNGGTKG